MRGVFFGSNPRVAEIVNRTVRLGTIVLERKSFSREMFDFAHYVAAKFFCVDIIDGITEHAGQADIGVSCGFGLIFTSKCIGHFPQGILNIHYGDLPNYRSRHPVSWAMIRGEERIGVTIHKIDEQIDCGYLVHKFFIERSYSDDLHTIGTKIEEMLAIEFPKAIERVANSDLVKLGSGTYFPRIDKTFREVEPKKMVSNEIYSLFMSQRSYGGVNILGNIKNECHIFDPQFKEHYEGYEIFQCADNVLVAVK